MDEVGAQVAAASNTSCCSISKAPIPQLQYKVSDLSLAAPIAVLDPTSETPRVQRLPRVFLVHDLSPPSFQSLLCTFLI